VRADFTKSWRLIEDRCRAYFNSVLETVDGITGYSMQSFPAQMPSDNHGYFIWQFSINGGAVGVHRQTREALPGGVWEMDAEFMALCADDEAALNLGGLVWQQIPVLGTDVDGLARLYPTAYPSRERALVNLGGNVNANQEQVFFRMVIPMRAVFGNVEETEE